jgi:flavin reductase (DIM6/NTAB) family NADH-FMN oxidoreductase RutF/DNA-binding IclR family transcriptional regulator
VTTAGTGEVDRVVEPHRFREVLGHLPTGVVVITALDESGAPLGMTIGSFSSASLDPPLVAFFPDRASASFRAIRQASSFCVNILSAQQEAICRTFALRGGDKFRDVTWTPCPSGAPVIDGVVAWIDCEQEAIHEAGDHYVVLGRVRDLGVATPAVPLLFFQGGYGGFAPVSLTVGGTADMLESLLVADRARPAMVAVAAEVDAACHALVRQGGDIVVVSSVYPAAGGSAAPLHSRVGVRIPLVLPGGDLYLAWEDEETQERWIGGLGNAVDEEQRATIRANLHRARAWGWGFTIRTLRATGIGHVLDRIATYGVTPATERELAGLVGEAGLSGDPGALDQVPDGGVRTISAPVLDRDGRLVLMLSLYNLPPDRPIAQIRRNVAALRRVADHVGGLL